MLLIYAGLGLAHASYICDLTSTDIEDVDDYYELDMTLSEYEAWVDAPFDCSAYGELCELIDADDAEDVVCASWESALASADLAEIQNDFTTSTEYMAGLYTDTSTWGTGTSSGCSGVGKKEERQNSAGDRKFRVKAYFTIAVFYHEIGGNTKGLERDGGGGPWHRDHQGVVTNSTTYTSTGPVSGLCTSGIPREPSRYGADDDGFVKSHKGATRANLLPESVESIGTYWGLTACAVNTATWNDATCN